MSPAFRQQHRHAAMRQAVGLDGAVVYRHAGANEIIAHFQELNAQVGYRAVGVVRRE